MLAVTLDIEGTCVVTVMPVWPKRRLAEAGRESEVTSQKA
jgi:hypothetical protein